MLEARSPKRPIAARVVPAAHGWLWIRQGWQLYRQRPLQLTSILASFLFAMILVSALLGTIEAGMTATGPGFLAKLVIGMAGACVAATVPGITAGFMEACKRVLAKQPLRADVLLEPFRRDRSTARNLLILGAVQVAALVLVIAISPDVSAPADPVGKTPVSRSPSAETTGPASDGNGTSDAGSAVSPTDGSGRDRRAAAELPDPERVLAEKKRALVVGLLQMLVYLPVTIVLWYAPMLVYWHAASAPKAMFFSTAAVWRNRAAFTVYGLAWSACLFVAAYLLAMLLALLEMVFGLGTVAFAALAPFILVLFTWTYCSIYLSYTSVFGEQPARTPAGSPEAKPPYER